jgi:branched-chain amino acid transport system permease protein
MAGLARILAVAVSDWPFAGDSVGLTLPSHTPFAVYVGTAAGALAPFGLNLCFARSGFGLDAISVRDDEEAAAAVGVPTTRVKVWAFTLSALLPAVAGGLVAWNRSFIAFLAIPALGSAYVLQLATDILTFTILAYSWNLISGFTGYLSFGQVSVLHSEGVVAGRAILELQDLTVRFGGVLALDRISLEVRQGETVSIIGANGAGKTTLFSAITGFVTASGGDIRYKGESTARRSVAACRRPSYPYRGHGPCSPISDIPIQWAS